MAGSIYVTSTHRGSGKTALCLGLVAALERSLGRVAYFKPVTLPTGPGVATDAQLVKEALGLPYEVASMQAVSSDEVKRALAAGTKDQLFDRILEAYEDLRRQADFVVVEGTDYEGSLASFEFEINAELAKSLGAPVVLVADAENAFETTLTGKVRDPRALETMLDNVRLVLESLAEQRCEPLGLILNRANPGAAADIRAIAGGHLLQLGVRVLGAVPRSVLLDKPTLAEIAAALEAEVLAGGAGLDVAARELQVAAMGLDQALGRVQRDALIIVPADRSDLLVGLAASYASPTVPAPAGLLLTGGMEIPHATRRLMDDLTRGSMPLLRVRDETYDTAVRANAVEARLRPGQQARIDSVIDLVDRHVDIEPVLALTSGGSESSRVTPRKFLHRVVEIARKDRRHVVLPEGSEERILRAAEIVRARDFARLTLLGNEGLIRGRIRALGLDLDDVAVVDPATDPWREPFAREYQRLRAHKTPSFDLAYDLMEDPSYFGTMMVQLGRADGMVSGSIHTTAATLRPALEFVKTAPERAIASSVFFMLLPDAVLVYGDCAVNPNPTAAHLADIALASAQTAAAFQIPPRVAMLSYSTGSSGRGSDVEKVREATRLVRERAPELLVEGPIQYDAAIDPGVAATKLPGSPVAGQATVFVFPDLNAGNNTYKAVQRAARAIAVGPVMQGLRKPVNDLSRGCTVPDIVNTIAITAVQAQGDRA